ncbi:Eco57I restriction-modification methylase domain-containing protein [Changpingibacter yushuensis]|uniref:Eco57I restriction-modification methylase domain-containing protein n=1 Tax=Changpingibacter yushuensis TaxID=2758440 RepID=UPI00165E8F59|nr:Eco57I restriction-modification methylase domain-containing protein [Changpingibacter yushuensis]
MSTPQASFVLRGHNPDVLTCIANLSNDEVFTPPEMANAMLDLLAGRWAAAHDGADIWADPNVTFLDPFTKSGVFLREITRRLTDGLVRVFPDRVERVDHILTRQVYGIGITQLTALLARRSVYCSKYANGPRSIARSFDCEDGNIWFQRTEHAWTGGQKEYRADPLTGGEKVVYTHRRCRYCGAAEDSYGRGDELETHAYAFIHTDDIKARICELFGDTMQFDVVIGNPPYQLSDGGGAGTSARPIYNKFVEAAKGLDPRFMVMIIPSRWFAGGKGLDGFRSDMLHDRRIRTIVDYPNSREVFAGVDIAGGVCYFLWDRDTEDDCVVQTIEDGVTYSAVRRLDAHDIFIRDNRVLEIVERVNHRNTLRFSTLVSRRRPFDLDAALKPEDVGDLLLYTSSGDGYISREIVPKGLHLADQWKVLLSKTSSEHAGQTNKDGKKRVFSRIEVMPPGSVATESYLIVGPFSSQFESESAASYLRTKFVRFLVSSVLLTQNITRSMFEFVPVPHFSQLWTDELLYNEYELTCDSIDLIERSIKEI